MLILSLLVKTLTSVNQELLDYYSDNLKHECSVWPSKPRENPGTL